MTRNGKIFLSRAAAWAGIAMLMAIFQSAGIAGAAGGDPLWQYGHAAAGRQEAFASVIDGNGDVVITGMTATPGKGEDFFTLKVKGDGSSTLWANTFDLAGLDDRGLAVSVDSKGDVIVTGYANTGVAIVMHTVKYCGETKTSGGRCTPGGLLWQHSYFRPDSGFTYPTAMATDDLDNIYVTGYFQAAGGKEDGFVLKYGPGGPNPDGEPLWQAVFNGAADGIDRLLAIAAHSQHGVAVTGYSRNAKTPTSDFDLVLLHFDAFGNKHWEKIYDGGPGDDLGQLVAMDNSGNVIVAATTWGGSQKDIQTVKLRQDDGTTLWQAFYRGGTFNEPRSLALDSGGDVYIAGVTFTTSGLNDVVAARYTGATGVKVWESVFDSGIDNHDIARGLVIDEDGDVFVAGYTHKDASGDDDFLTIKFKRENGHLLWASNFDGPQHRNEQAVALGAGIAPDGSIIVSGWSDQGTATLPDLDYYCVKYDGGLLNAPTHLTASVVSDGGTGASVVLSWEDHASNEDLFIIERCAGIGCTNHKAIDTVVANQIIYTDTTVENSVWYSYQVRARSVLHGDSHASNSAEVLANFITYAPPSWLYIYNGPENSDDIAYAIAAGPDLHPVATGTSLSPNMGSGRFDYFTVKLNRATAAPLWSARYDDPDSEDDIATCLAIDNSNNVTISGYASMFSGGLANSNDICTLKYTANGPPQYGDPYLWLQCYDGPAQNDDRAVAIDTVSDGSNSFVTGYGRNTSHNDDIFVLKYRGDGVLLWAAVPYDRGSNDYPAKAVLDSAGNLFITGKSHNGIDYDIVIRKYDGATGAAIWTKIVDSGHGNDAGKGIAVDNAGNVYVAGSVSTAYGTLDMFIGKYDSLTGADLWNGGKSIDGPAGLFDEAVAIAIDNSGNPIVAGSTTSDSNTSDFTLLRLNLQGDILWQQILERPQSDDYAVIMAMDQDGNVCIAGDTENGSNFDILSLHYDAGGNLLGSTLYQGPANGDDTVEAVTMNRVGEAFIAGSTTNASGNSDFLVFRCGGQVLLAPALATAYTALYTNATVTWNDNTLREDGFTVQRKPGSCATPGVWTTVDVVAANTVQFVDTGLQTNTVYCYQVQAFTNGGETSPWAQGERMTLSPPVPMGLTVTPVSSTQLNLVWNDTTNGEDGFLIERCNGASCTSFSPVGTSPVPSFTDLTVCEGSVYRYQVLAYKTGHWESGFSIVAQATVPAKMTPPVLTATALSEGEVSLTWTAAGSDYEGTRIWRCQDAGCTNMSLLATVPRPLAFTNTIVSLEMDEPAWTGAVGEVKDTSADGRNHGSVSGGATTRSDGHQGRAGNFDGVDDKVSYSFAGGTPTDNFTIAAWVKATTTHEIETQATAGTGGTSGQRYLFGATHMGTTSSGAGISVGTNGISVYEHGSGYMPALAVASVSLGTGWKHVVVTYTNKQPRIYLNGALVQTGLTSPRAAVYAPTTVGCGDYGCFSGVIDQVQIFNRPFTDSEVQQYYTRGSSSMSYHDFVVEPGITYRYQVGAYKPQTCNGEWISSSAIKDVNLPAVQPPGAVAAAAQNSSAVKLTWTDPNAFETGFAISRCQGAGCSSFTAVATAAANTLVYLDGGLCANTVYRYQLSTVHPKCAANACDALPVTVTTTAAAAPAALTATRLSEGAIKLDWTDSTSDETGFDIERCQGAGCDFTTSTHLAAGAGVTTFTDRGLPADTVCRYRVRAVKTGACGWPSLPSPAAETTTTVATPVPSVTTASTTSTRLAWSDTAILETGYGIDRCLGAGCSNFTRIATVAANATAYTDTGVCSGSVYTYRLAAVDDGLTLGNGGCWTRKKPLQISGWAPQAVVRVDVVYDTDMRSDFADLRFYDESSAQELPYWFESLRPGQKVTVWIKTDTSASISFYYGNPSATSMNNPSAFSVEFHDDFQGAVIDVAKWKEIDVAANGIVQNNDLIMTPVTVGWQMALISEQKFDRGNNRTFYLRATPKETAGSNIMTGGFIYDQTTSSNYDQVVHGLYWYDTYFSVFEKSSGYGYQYYVPYTKGVEMEGMIELKAAGGALYSARQGAGTPWQLIYNRTGFTDTPLRVALLNYSHEIAIHSVAVMPRQMIPEKNATLGVEESASCFAFLTWSKPSVPVAITMPSPQSVAPLLATGLTESSIRLQWSDNNGDETGILIRRCAGSGCSDYTLVTTAAANSTVYTDTGLNLASPYTYEVKAHKDATCPWDSPPVTATTSTLAPPAPSGLAVSFTGSANIGLAWQDNTGGETGFVIERCAGAGCTDYSAIAETATNAVAYTDTTVCTVSTYRYRVKAVNRSLVWESGYSAEVTATTQGIPSAKPVLTVNRLSEQALFLTWTDSIADESGFAIERCVGAGCSSFAPLGTAAANGVAYTDNTVIYGGTYCYRLRPVSETACGWQGTWSDSQCGTATANPPGAVTAQVRDTTTVFLSWTDNTITETGFAISRCEGSGCTNFGAPIATVAANAIAYTDITAKHSTIYRYQASALVSPVNPAGVSNNITLPTPAAPVLQATRISEIRINLTWSDNTQDETDFQILRAANTSCTGLTSIATVSANVTGYTDTNVTAGTSYCYQVAARKTATNSWSVPSGTQVRETTILAPTAVAATPVNTTDIVLTWTDNTASETGFAIERCQGANCTQFAPLVTAPANASRYTDGTACAGSTYRYQLQAVKTGTGAWTSPMSQPSANATTPVAVDPVLTVANTVAGDVLLSWTDQYNDESGYTIERCLGANCTQFSQILTAAANAVSITDTTVNASTSYCYQLKVAKTSSCGWSKTSQPQCLLSLQDAPTTLTATAFNSRTVRLAWVDNGQGEDGFEVEMKLANSRFVRIGQTSANITTYTAITGIEPQKQYTFRVRGKRGSEVTAYTNDATVTTPAWQQGDAQCVQ